VIIGTGSAGTGSASTASAGTDNTIQQSDLQAFINNLNSLNQLGGNVNPLDLRSQANFIEASFSVSKTTSSLNPPTFPSPPSLELCRI
jgi:hypothetical protein